MKTDKQLWLVVATFTFEIHSFHLDHAAMTLLTKLKLEDQKFKKRERKQRTENKQGEDVREQDVQESMLSSYIYHGPIRQEETGAH